MTDMNHKTIIKTLAFVAVAYLAGTVWATPRLRMMPLADDTDTLTVDTTSGPMPIRRYLPGEIRDTAAFNEQQRAKDRQLYVQDIKVLCRTYGDSVVLRWSAPDYVTWRHLIHVGVDVLRLDPVTGDIDTLALALKPLPLERFRQIYGEKDSVASMGYGSIYNLDHYDESNSKEEPGSMGSLFDIHQDQMMALGVAVLVSEWRPDMANHMAMRFVDKKVKRGEHYSYSIVPSQEDTTMHVMLNVGLIEDVENVPQKPQPFDVTITDSVTPPSNVQINWEDRVYSSYEIERREKGQSKWARLNDKPYLVMLPELGGQDCFYGDVVPHPGTYEYRILAHDPFGDLTEPSPIHTVKVGDMEAPRPPQITWINIERPRENDPSAEVWAEIHFEKDTMEVDFVGCVPMYHHERATEGKWRPLLDKPLARTDTVCRIDVTNLVSGDVTIAAYDTAHNVSYAIPQLLRVSDMRPPKAPTGLTAKGNAETGTITLTWNALDEADDVDYYEIVFANDTTHQFMIQKHGQTRDTVWTDTISMEANQKYIYYKVRAVDFSQNIGDFSERLQVIRPSNVPPAQAHLDSTAVDGKGIYMRWIAGNDELMAYHWVLRRLESQEEWTLLRVCNADSVKACHDVIEILDTPDASVKEQWVYAIESFNYSDVSSGLSLQYMVRFDGELLFSWPVRLHGDYVAEQGETHLAWEMEANPPYSGEWYFCIYRQGPDDERPQFLLSAQPEERSFEDRLLQPGEQAHYYIMIQYADGRASEPSNTVTVSAPAEKKK